MCAPRARGLLPELGASSQCTVGAIAELTVSIGLMNVGYAVYRSFSHNAPCDLVAIKGDRILRIEVKTITAADKIPTVDRRKFDHLALVMRNAEVRFEPPLPDALIRQANA
jgi:Holliday junction resolvase